MHTVRINPSPSVEEQVSAAIEWSWLPHFVERSRPVSREQAEEEVAAGRRISVTDAAEAAGVNRSFIKAEIRRGNLPATKNATGNWEIRLADFREWMSNPKRGSRSR